MKIYICGCKLSKRGAVTFLVYALLMLLFIASLVIHGNDGFTIMMAIIGASILPVAVIDSTFTA